jgi:hypothetical protein
MLFKIWLNNAELGFDFSIIVDVDSLDIAIIKAQEYSKKYNANIKAIDNIHSGTTIKTKEDKGFRANHDTYRRMRI